MAKTVPIRKMRLGEKESPQEKAVEIKGRSTDDIVVLVQQLGIKQVVPTLETEEVERLVDDYLHAEARAKAAGLRFGTIKDLILSYARENDQQVIEGIDGAYAVTKEGKGAYIIQPFDVACLLLEQNDLTKEEMQKQFNDLFSVGIEKAKRYFGELKLDAVGGKKLTAMELAGEDKEKQKKAKHNSLTVDRK